MQWVHKEAKQQKKQKACSSSSIPQTFFLRWMQLFLHKLPLLGSSKHNAQQIPLATK
jgi:hypothetical protein